MPSDLLSRLDAAAKGHEAQHGEICRSIFHDAADEIRRLSEIERDVRVLVGCSIDITGSDRNGTYWKPTHQGGPVSLNELTKQRSQAAARLLAAIKAKG